MYDSAMELSAPLRVVTSAVDGDVLGVLARADTEFTVSDLRLRIDRSAEGIRRALGRLVEQGIVIRRSVGRVSSYRLNRSHLAAPAILDLAELPMLLRRRIGDEIGTWPSPPLFAAIFGSAARNEMRADSDIDIVLVGDVIGTPAGEERVAGLARSISEWTGNDARLLVYSESEVRGRFGDEAILTEILEDGIPLAGDRRAFRRLVGA